MQADPIPVTGTLWLGAGGKPFTTEHLARESLKAAAHDEVRRKQYALRRELSEKLYTLASVGNVKHRVLARIAGVSPGLIWNRINEFCEEKGCRTPNYAPRRRRRVNRAKRAAAYRDLIDVLARKKEFEATITMPLSLPHRAPRYDTKVVRETIERVEPYVDPVRERMKEVRPETWHLVFRQLLNIPPSITNESDMLNMTSEELDTARRRLTEDMIRMRT